MQRSWVRNPMESGSIDNIKLKSYIPNNQVTAEVQEAMCSRGRVVKATD